MAELEKMRPRPQGAWTLQDAKARFSEVVRLARIEGPQRVTVRGQATVVVIAADALDRLMPQTSDALPFVAFMESLAADELDLTRERDFGRDAAL